MPLTCVPSKSVPGYLVAGCCICSHSAQRTLSRRQCKVLSIATLLLFTTLRLLFGKYTLSNGRRNKHRIMRCCACVYVNDSRNHDVVHTFIHCRWGLSTATGVFCKLFRLFITPAAVMTAANRRSSNKYSPKAKKKKMCAFACVPHVHVSRATFCISSAEMTVSLVWSSVFRVVHTHCHKFWFTLHFWRVV